MLAKHALNFNNQLHKLTVKNVKMNVSGELQALDTSTNPPSQTAANKRLKSYWN